MAIPAKLLLSIIVVAFVLNSVFSVPSTDDPHTSFDSYFNFTPPTGFFNGSTVAEVRLRATLGKTEPATTAVPVSYHDGTSESELPAFLDAVTLRRDFVYVDSDCAKIDGRIFAAAAAAERGSQILCKGTGREIYARVVPGEAPVEIPYNITDNGGLGHASQQVHYKQHPAGGLVVKPTPSSLLYDPRGNNTVFLHISAPPADAKTSLPVWRTTLIEWVDSNGVSMGMDLLIARIERFN